MKRFLWTWVAAVGVVALAFFTVFDGKRIENKENETESQKQVMKLPIDSVARIEIKTRNATTVLDKDPGKPAESAWRLSSPVQDEADFLAVESLLNQAEAEKSHKTVAEGEKLDLKAFGLDEPLTRLMLSDKNGKSVEIRIGSVRAYDGSLYARIGDEKKVLLVSSGWDLMLAKLPKDFRNKRPLRQSELKLADLKRIVLRPKGAAPFELVRGENGPVEDGPVEDGPVENGQFEKWQVKGGEDFPVDGEKVAGFFERIKDFRARDFAEDETAKKAGAALAKAPASVAFYKESQAKAQPVFTMTIAFDPASKTEDYFGRSSDLAQPLLMTRSALDVFDKTAQDFYDRKRPFRFAAAEIARVEVASPELKASFDKKGDAWELAAGDLRKKADSARLNELVARLSQMEALRILAPQAPKAPQANDKFASRISLKKADGALVFELAWGVVEIEKASGHRPEARFLRASAKTSSEYRVGIAEGEIENLGLAALVVDESKAGEKPAQQAARPAAQSEEARSAVTPNGE